MTIISNDGQTRNPTRFSRPPKDGAEIYAYQLDGIAVVNSPRRHPNRDPVGNCSSTLRLQSPADRRGSYRIDLRLKTRVERAFRLRIFPPLQIL